MMELIPKLVLSVSEINSRARQLLDRHLGQVRVCGEISNNRVDGNGHRWFCLKDAASVLPAVMFRRDNAALGFACRDGDQVVATGRLTLYAAQGRYQMVVGSLEPQGEGALQAAFARLKQRLQAEGLFAAERKRPLPLLPRCVVLLTSQTGAVLRDFLQVATRRFPSCWIVLVPVRVQGSQAAPDLLAGIERALVFATVAPVDVLVVARGGGSLEELSGFNDERVARALAASPVPTVSAVGHETDFTIADFVADVRAPTPSAAAELIFAQQAALVARLSQLHAQVVATTQRLVAQRRLSLRAARGDLGDGRRHLQAPQQRLALCTAQLQRSARRCVAQHREALRAAAERLAAGHPKVSLRAWHERLAGLQRRLHAAMRQTLTVRRARLDQVGMQTAVWRRQQAVRRARVAALTARLQALSPLAVLQRGYGIVLDPQGRAVRSPAQVSEGTVVDVRVHEGRFAAKVLPGHAAPRRRNLT